jgi:hypothetical protein
MREWCTPVHTLHAVKGASGHALTAISRARAARVIVMVGRVHLGESRKAFRQPPGPNDVPELATCGSRSAS